MNQKNIKPPPDKIILLPGMDGTGLLFTPLLKYLKQDLHVQIIAYPPDKELSLNELVDFVRAKASFDEKTLLLAESFSGLIAIELLKDKNITLHSMILCACFASTPRPWLLNNILKLPLKHLLKLPIPTPLLRYYGLGWHTETNETKNIQRAISKIRPTILAQRLRIIRNAKNTPIKPMSLIPCHYLQASTDRLVPAKQATLFQQYFSIFTIHKIPQAGHFLLQRQPAICANIILNITNPEVNTSASESQTT